MNYIFIKHVVSKNVSHEASIFLEQYSGDERQQLRFRTIIDIHSIDLNEIITVTDKNSMTNVSSTQQVVYEKK